MSVKFVTFPLFIIGLVLLPYSIIADDGCYSELDILHVQDRSASFHRFWPNITRKVEKVVQEVKDKEPYVYFGLATFGDKNISGVNKKTKTSHTLGNKSDYCLKVAVPLKKKPDARTVVRRFRQYHRNPVRGDADSPGCVFEAIHRAVVASKLQRSPKSLLGRRMREIIVVTGTTSHLKGDVRKLTGQKRRNYDITHSGVQANKNNENYDCDKVEYPTVKHVVDAVNRLKDTRVVILVAPGGRLDSKGRFIPYQSVAGLDEKYQHPSGLLYWYTDQLGSIESRQIFVEQLDPEMSGYSLEVGDVLSRFRKYRCPEPPTNNKN